MRKKSEKKAILVTFPLENIRSSGDDAWFELRWWWFELRRWRLQLQRWRFELWWCFDLVFSFYYTQLWIALLQCDISCLSWLVLFSVLWSGVFLKLNLVTMVLFRRKVSCISRHLYNLAKWFTIFFAIQIIKKRDGLMKTYNTWAKLLQRQQLNQIQTQQKLMLIIKKGF